MFSIRISRPPVRPFVDPSIHSINNHIASAAFSPPNNNLCVWLSFMEKKKKLSIGNFLVSLSRFHSLPKFISSYHGHILNIFSIQLETQKDFTRFPMLITILFYDISFPFFAFTHLRFHFSIL